MTGEPEYSELRESDYPIRILSDIHYKFFGSLVQNHRQLQHLFSGCRTVILNGDSVEELWFGTDTASRHRAELQQAADSVGARLLFVQGNHDPFHGHKQLAILHGQQRLLLTHGDFGFPALPPSRKSALSRPFTFALFFLRNLPHYHVYWRQCELAMKLNNSATLLILGHTHRPYIKTVQGRTVVNLGAHMKGFNHTSLYLAHPKEPIELHDSQQRCLVSL